MGSKRLTVIYKQKRKEEWVKKSSRSWPRTGSCSKKRKTGRQDDQEGKMIVTKPDNLSSNPKTYTVQEGIKLLHMCTVIYKHTHTHMHERAPSHAHTYTHQQTDGKFCLQVRCEHELS